MAPPHQGPRRHAYCKIMVGGEDVTDRMKPHLISVQIVDKLSFEIDKCSIELDDRDGRLQIPPDGELITVHLGWSGEGPRIPPVPPNIPPGELPFGGGGLLQVFRGTVDSCESGFSRRGGGRRLWIEALGASNQGHAKTPDMKSWGVGEAEDQGDQGGGGGQGGGGSSGGVPLSQVMEESAKAAGLKMMISPSMGKMMRDYWHQNESFQNFGTRIAQEVGGHFKIVGDMGILISATDGLNAQGQPLRNIDAYWGINLISWRIKPFAGRPQYGQGKSIFFDTKAGKWLESLMRIPGTTPFGGSSALAQLPNPAPNRLIGEQMNGGTSATSQARRGTGWVIINGEPEAHAGDFVNIVGARPGVDGRYRIKEAEHNYSRRGYITRCDVDQPDLAKDGYKGWPDRGTPEGETSHNTQSGTGTAGEATAEPPKAEVEIGDIEITNSSGEKL